MRLLLSLRKNNDYQNTPRWRRKYDTYTTGFYKVSFVLVPVVTLVIAQSRPGLALFFFVFSVVVVIGIMALQNQLLDRIADWAEQRDLGRSVDAAAQHETAKMQPRQPKPDTVPAARQTRPAPTSDTMRRSSSKPRPQAAAAPQSPNPTASKPSYRLSGGDIIQ